MDKRDDIVIEYVVPEAVSAKDYEIVELNVVARGEALGGRRLLGMVAGLVGAVEVVLLARGSEYLLNFRCCRTQDEVARVPKVAGFDLEVLRKMSKRRRCGTFCLRG